MIPQKCSKLNPGKLRGFLLYLNMKNIVIVLLLVSSSLMAQQNCKAFKTGTFEYTQKGYEGYQISRTATHQVEENKAKGYRAEASVKWLSDCEYQLTYLKANDKSLLGKTIKVRILRTVGDKYTFHATMGKQVLTTEVRRIKSH